ncbi:hypothetical protein EYZ11_000373 [Aspergillus tanneri]|uniref:Lysine-specific metallo-endopeptidase domain-containing protein n=1 Tax=Aspergillus tanneri TaxID=1220188 RepID=A0A4S3JXB9_9EURO|nr:hypothetical protein EYZ11_000373 [Aspergillus tanneri]
MDAAALFDHTLLHELTHAIGELPTSDTSGYFSYGWKRCVKLARDHEKGINNADNYAYFALARMLAAWRIAIGAIGAIEYAFEILDQFYECCASFIHVAHSNLEFAKWKDFFCLVYITSINSIVNILNASIIIPITNADTTTQVTYTATTTEVDRQPTGVWKCHGEVCNPSGCTIPTFCTKSDLGASWGLCFDTLKDGDSLPLLFYLYLYSYPYPYICYIYHIYIDYIYICYYIYTYYFDYIYDITHNNHHRYLPSHYIHHDKKIHLQANCLPPRRRYLALCLHDRRHHCDNSDH